ncbi:PAS domain-containing protein [Christensenella sp. NSJ-35]|uniref:Stage 0 sporulation protein A homolog n=2 Tax=Christensenella tenuis TaxID=2763033 RepID=A0ABR7ECB5_9FIRM|nr:PAS domain-containing protein [Christensenella tenuis]
MEENALITVLNHLPDMAIYVIRQDNHHILYFNDRVRKVTPEVELGRACHDLWKGMCRNCPLHEIGQNESNTTVSYNEPFGKAVNISATRIMWEDKIPAFIISITPYIQTEKEIELEQEKLQLAAAVSQIYPMVISVNLTRNRFAMVEYEYFDAKAAPEEGNFDELIEIGVETMHPNFKEEFRNKFSRERLLENFADGKREIYMEHRQMGDDGQYHWTNTRVMQVDNPFSDDILEITLCQNIDSLKNTEEELQNSLKIACEHSGGMTGKYLVTDSHIFLLEASRKYFEFFDTKLDDYRETIFLGVPPRRAKEYTELICKAGASRENVDLEIPFVMNGNMTWLQVQAGCIGEQDGWPVYFGTILDITKRKQMEIEREVTYNSMPGGVAKIVIDEDMTIQEANGTFYDMLGTTPEQCGNWISLVYPEDRDNIRVLLREQVEKDCSIFTEYRMKRTDGRFIWVHVEGKKIGEQKGKPIYLVVVVNITEQKEAQIKLEKEQARYRVAVETSADVLFEYVNETDTFYVYQNNESTSGAPLGEKNCLVHYLRDLEKYDIVYPDDIPSVRKIMQGDSRRMEIRLRRPGTKKFVWYFFQGDALREGDKILRVIGTLRNIDKIKENENKSEFLQRMFDFVCNKDYQMMAILEPKTWICHCPYQSKGSPFYKTGIHDFHTQIRLFIARFVLPEDRERVEKELKPEEILSRLKAEDDEYNVYFRMAEHSGEYRWKSMTFSYFRQDRNMIFMALRDIQTIRNAKFKERIANETLEVALNRIYDEVLYVDLKKNKIVYRKSNNKYQRIANSNKMFFEQSALPYIHSADKQLYRKNMNCERLTKRLAEKGSIHFQCRRKGEDGLYHWVSTTVVRTDYSDGIAAMVLVRTIDNQKQMEQDKEEFTMGITALLDECITLNVTEGTFVARKTNETWGDVAREGLFEPANKAYCDKTVHPEDRAAFRNIFSLKGIRRQLQAGHRKISREIRRLAPDGTYHWVEMTVVAIENKVGDDIKAILTYRDIHALKVAQEEEENTNRRLAAATARLYRTVYEGDLNTGMLYRWKNTLGTLKKEPAQCTLEEHFTHVAEEIIHPEYKEDYRERFSVQALYEAFAQGKQEIYLEAPRKMPDGTYRWHSMQAQVIRRDDKWFTIMMYLKDLDDAKKAEEREHAALVDALYLAESANKAKMDFFSRMSHDIRTPMNGIIGMTNIAAMHVENAKTKECLEKIGISAHFLLSLINDFLDMSKIESGKMQIENRIFRIEDLTDSLSAVLQTQINQKKQTLHIKVSPNVGDVYIGDMLRLNQVLMNLLGNAIKYTQEGGEIGLLISAKHSRNDMTMIRFEVWDNGIGMSQEFLDKLYDPFEQENPDSGRVFQGTGLGLTITRNLVHLMHGQIYASSTLGEGSRFQVELPLHNKTAAAEQKEWEMEEFTESVNGLSFQGENILLVEDNEINLEIAQALLEMKGFCVETAVNGQEALDKFTVAPEGHFKAILMDIRMPVMDGLEATERIRGLKKKDARSVAIIAMTANAFQEEIETAKQAGMDEYLTKPIDTPALFRILQRYVKS